MDIEEIRRGRRRNWDKLKDPEERLREKQQAIEDDPEREEKKSSLRRREEARQEARQVDYLEWIKIKKQLLVVGLLTMVAVFIWMGIQWVYRSVEHHQLEKHVVELQALSEGSVPYESYSSPLDTWATWRNAWLRSDTNLLVRTYSIHKLELDRGQQTPSAYFQNLEATMNLPEPSPEKIVAKAFRDPEFLLDPESMPRDGALAVFRSPVQDFRNPSGPPRDWVLAIAWEGRTQKWKVEDLREATTWKASWSHVNMIPVSRLPIKENASRQHSNKSRLENQSRR